MSLRYNEQTNEGFILKDNEWVVLPKEHQRLNPTTGERFLLYNNEWVSAYVPPVDPNLETAVEEEQENLLPVSPLGIAKYYENIKEGPEKDTGILPNFLIPNLEDAINLQEMTGRKDQVVSKMLTDVVKSPVEVAVNVATMVAPEIMDEIGKKVEQFGPIKAINNYIDAFDSSLTDNEKITTDLAAYLSIAGLGRKAALKVFDKLKTKIGKTRGSDIARKVTGIIGGTLGLSHAGVQLHPEENTVLKLITQDEQLALLYEEMKKNPETEGDFTTKLLGFITDVNKNIPEDVKDALKTLEVNPGDERSTVLKKKYAEEIGFNASIGSILLALKFSTLGIAKTSRAISSLISKDKAAAKVPTTSKNTEVVSSEVVEEPIKLTASETKIINTETLKRIEAWALKRSKENNDPSIDMASEEAIIKAEFEKVKGEVTKEFKSLNVKVKEDTAPPAVVEEGVVAPTVAKEVVEEAPKIVQRNTFVEKLGSINNTLDKLFGTTKGLPKKVQRLILDRENFVKSEEGIYLAAIKQMRREKKKNNVTDEEFEAFISTGAKDNLPLKFVEAVRGAQDKIKGYNDRINDALGLKGDKRINAVVEGEEVYYTKTYQASTDKKYYRQFKNYFGGKKDTDDVIIKKIEDAKEFFRKQGVPEEELDTTIQTIVQRVSANTSDKSVVDQLLTGMRVGPTRASASLAKRNDDLPPEIQELLGINKEPFSKIETTFRKQTRLLAELEFVSSLRKYMLENVDSEVNLGGLFPLLPSLKAPITTRLIGNADTSLLSLTKDTKGDLFDKKFLLDKVFTSKAFGTNIAAALKLSSPPTSPIGSFIRQAAALAQGKETILDAPAYLLNTMGMVQNLAANGTLLYGRAYPEAIRSIVTLGKAMTARSNSAVNEVAILKKFGLIEQDATGELIVRMAGAEAGKSLNLYQKTMKVAAQAYGTPDAIGKLISYGVRKNQLKLTYPKAWYKETYKGNESYEDFIMNKAAEFTVDTMATYQRAPAVAQMLSRTPILGNYILFSTELLRTTKGMLKHASMDTGLALKRLAKGEKGAKQHLKMATKQLAGVAALGSGYALYTKDNNNSLKTESGMKAPITTAQQKFVNMVASPWGKGSSPLFLEPFVKDETKGKRKKGEGVTPYVRTRMVNSNSADMWDFIKGPTRLALAKIFGGQFAENFSPEVLDNAGKKALQSLTGQFTSPKFFVQAIMNVMSGVDANGKPIYNKLPGETDLDKSLIVLEELLKGTVKGGTYKIIMDTIKASKSEELLGEGRGLRASGFPLNSEDLKIYAQTGTRPQTINVDKAMGYHIYKDLKELTLSGKGFTSYIRTKVEYNPEVNDKDIQNIIDKYNDMQERRLRVMQKITKNLDVFKEVGYIRRYKDQKGNIQEEEKKFDVGGVLAAATGNFKSKRNKDLTAPLTKGLKNGKFVPDNPFNDQYGNLLALLKEKNFNKEQIRQVNKGLSESLSGFYKRSLKSSPNKEEGNK
jgi:hypothetical protein